MNKLKFFILIFFAFYVDGFSQDKTQGIRPLSFEEHVNLLLDQRDQFPGLLRQTRDYYPGSIIKDQRELLGELNANENFRRMMGERGDLLTIRIQEVADATNARLTLTEVHPHLAIFRGVLGNDFSTGYFGYPNSPMERVFFISDERGQAVGYLNGTIVKLANGKNAFFINTVAGSRISTLMTRYIFSAIAKAKDILEVEDIVILGKEHLRRLNINYSIRSAYENAQGDPVKVTFEDRDIDIRETIGESVYDRYKMRNDARILDKARYLKEPNADVVIQVEKQPFNGIYSITLRGKISPIDRFHIFVSFPDVSYELRGVPSLKHILGNASFFDFMANTRRINIVAYEDKWERILNAFGIEKKEHRRVLDELGYPYYIGYLESSDAFQEGNAKKSLEILEFISKKYGTRMRRDKKLSYLARYENAYEDFVNPNLKNALDSPEDLARKNAKMYMAEILSLNSKSILPSRAHRIAQAYRTIAPKNDLATVARELEKIIMDLSRDLEYRIEVFGIYKILAPQENIVIVKQKLQEYLKENPLYYDVFVPEDGPATVARKLEKAIMNLSKSAHFRVRIFLLYEIFASQENIVIVKQKLQESLKAKILELDIPPHPWGDEPLLERYIIAYEEIASRKDVVTVLREKNSSAVSGIFDEDLDTITRVNLATNYLKSEPLRYYHTRLGYHKVGVEKYVAIITKKILGFIKKEIKTVDLGTLRENLTTYKDFVSAILPKDRAAIKQKIVEFIKERLIDPNGDMVDRIRVLHLYENMGGDVRRTGTNRNLIVRIEEDIRAFIQDLNDDRNIRRQVIDAYIEFVSKTRATFRTRSKEIIKTIMLDSNITIDNRIEIFNSVGNDLKEKAGIDIDEIKKAFLPILEEEVFKTPSVLGRYLDIYEEGIGAEHPGRIKERLVAQGVDPSEFSELRIPDPPAQTQSELFDGFAKLLKKDGFCY